MTQKEKTDYKRKYNEENYDRIGLYLAQGQKERYMEIAKKFGMSLNAYIIKAIEEKIERDRIKEDIHER